MADLIGTQGSITFAGSDGPVVANVCFWNASFSREKFPTTRPGYTMMRFSYGPLYVSGILRMIVNDTDATHPIPTGVQATLVLLETSGQSYSFSASLAYLRKSGVDSLRGGQQYAEYAFDGNATATASAVTVV
jgi:hypothetical protein